jgi:hypothetical protein
VTTLQTMYRGLAPHKIMPMPGTHKVLLGKNLRCAAVCPRALRYV